MAIPTTQTPAPTQPQTATPAPATGGTPAAAAATPGQMTPEQMKQKAREALDQFTSMMGSGPMGELFKAFGFGGFQADPAAKAANAVFGEMTRKIVMITPEDEAKGYKQYDGKVETVEHNLRLSLQKMFDEKRLVLDPDPAKNQAEFDLLLKDVGKFAKAAVPKDGAYDPSQIMTALTARVKELGADITVRLETKLATPVAKVYGADIMYGEKLQVNGKSPDSIASIGLKDNEIDIHRMAGNGQLVLEGKVSIEQLKQILGDNITVQAYNHKHNDPMDLPKGAKPPIDGYYVSNDKGVGFYIGAGEISAATTKVDLSLTPERVAGATPTPTAAPQQQPTVAAPVV